jgi:uncharacterized protein
VFADSTYWIALLSPRDDLHDCAVQLTIDLAARNATIVTSSFVMTEVLNEFSRRGERMRVAAADFVSAIRARTDLIYVEGTADYFARALERYRRYRDKDWSLTDCSSMVIMGDLAITEALTHDSDFEQAGFAVLMADQ